MALLHRGNRVAEVYGTVEKHMQKRFSRPSWAKWPSNPAWLALAALALSGCIVPKSEMAAPDVPEKLRPGSGEELAMIVRAQGVQIYDCKAKSHADSYEWTFVAPEASLYDAYGNRIGRHFAGPRWESEDGSRIAGVVKDKIDAPRFNAIPWLLLTATPEGPAGAFSNVTSVQRVNTVGGTAPTSGCTPISAGTRIRVPYVADYVFWTPAKPTRGYGD